MVHYDDIHDNINPYHKEKEKLKRLGKKHNALLVIDTFESI
jgi:hypothetical protein